MIYLSVFILISANFLLYKFDEQPFNRSPLKMFSIATAIYYTIPAIAIGLFSVESIFFEVNRGLLAYQNFIIVVFMSIVLVVSRLIPNSKKKYANYNFNEKKVIRISLFLVFVGGLTKLYLFNIGLYSLEDTFNENYLNVPRLYVFLRNIDLWGFIFLSIIVCKNLYSGKYKYLNFIYFFEVVFLVGFSILQGRRTGAILPIVIFVLSYSFYHKLNLKKFVVPLAISLFLMLTTTFSRLLETGQYSNSEIRKIIYEVIFSRLANTYVILNKVIEQGGLANLNSFELSFVGLIPSFLLSDKPNLSIGNEFGKELGLINIDNVTTGINPGWIGESYYNSGMIGVIIGAIMFSLLISYFYKKSFFMNDSSKILLLMMFIFVFSGYQMEIAASLNNFLKGYLILIFLSGFIPKLTIGSR